MTKYELVCDLSGSRDPEAMFKDIYYARSKTEAIQMAHNTWEDDVFVNFNVVTIQEKEEKNELCI